MTRKRGNKLGYWFFKMAFKLFGLRGSYGLLYLVVPYYIVFDRKAVLSVKPYIERKFSEAGFWGVYKHAFFIFLSFGKQLIDRYVFFNDEKYFKVSLKEDELLKSLSSDRGFIILNSHIGNWQFALHAIKYFKRRVHVVMRSEDNIAARESLKLYGDTEDIKIITPSEDNLGGVIDIINVLRNGGIVSIAGDRSYGAEVVDVDFLDCSASFPYSAFKIAAELECPISILLTSKLSETEYEVDLSKLIFPKYTTRKNKKEQLRPYVQKYADIISDYLNKHPHNCFLFDDVWD